MDIGKESDKLKDTYENSKNQRVHDVCGNKYKTSSNWLRILGIFCIIIGILVALNQFISSNNFISGSIAVISGVISGSLFIGFSEIIDLLTIIAEKK